MQIQIQPNKHSCFKSIDRNHDWKQTMRAEYPRLLQSSCQTSFIDSFITLHITSVYLPGIVSDSILLCSYFSSAMFAGGRADLKDTRGAAFSPPGGGGHPAQCLGYSQLVHDLCCILWFPVPLPQRSELRFKCVPVCVT